MATHEKQIEADQATLRDMFAAHALTGLLAGESPEVGMYVTDDTKTGAEKVAAVAYAHADAMLKARIIDVQFPEVGEEGKGD